MESITIDLHKYKVLNEVSLATFGSNLMITLKAMFGTSGFSPNLTVRGTQKDVQKFVMALAGEKMYMKSYLKHGLDDPRTQRDKYKLQNAVKAFERETGIKWPFK